MTVQYFEGVGRRKESVARVRLMSGSGNFVVNDKEAQAFFTRRLHTAKTPGDNDLAAEKSLERRKRSLAGERL